MDHLSFSLVGVIEIETVLSGTLLSLLIVFIILVPLMEYF